MFLGRDEDVLRIFLPDVGRELFAVAYEGALGQGRLYSGVPVPLFTGVGVFSIDVKRELSLRRVAGSLRWARQFNLTSHSFVFLGKLELVHHYERVSTLALEA